MHGLLRRETTGRPRAEWTRTAPAARGPALPTRVVDWLPFLWAHVLFPGTPRRPGAWRWRPFALVLVASGALLYPCLSFPLFEPDEGRYAQIPREMLQADEWVVPTLQGRPYLDKPPLCYWLVMLAYTGLGYHDWAARLVPALAVHGTVLLTFGLGRRLVGGRAALWGALLLAASPAFLGMGRLLLLDGLLTFWVTLALSAGYLAQAGPRLHRGWWLLAALACGFGVLTKGPVAVVLPLVPLWAHRRLTPPRARIGLTDCLAFAAVVLALALPWYVLVCCRLPSFARHFLWEHNVLRFAQPFDHVQPVWYYLPILLGGLLPVTLLGPALAQFLLSGRGEDSRRRPPELGYLLLAGGWCVLFFSLSGCKLPTYVLPAFAPLCLAAGCGVAARQWHRSRWLIAATAGCWLLLVAAHYAVVPWYAWQRSPLNGPGPLLEHVRDPQTPVACFSRGVDSVAFYLGRSDFHTFHSRERGRLLEFLDRHDHVVLLFSHRHSLDTLRQLLPPHLRMTETAPMGPCEIALVERITGRPN
jgi:4-amino-4-deoxy-L-arabinose transferase-like glycosyltransferase